MAIVKGATYQVSVDGERLKCQLDATATLGQDMETEDACKPEFTSTGGEIVWQADTPGNKNWEISGSGKIEDDGSTLSNDTLTASRTLSRHFINSNEPIEVSVGTVDPTLDMAVTYSGTAQITSFTLNFPATGGATYDYTFTGIGALTQTDTPRVP